MDTKHLSEGLGKLVAASMFTDKVVMLDGNEATAIIDHIRNLAQKESADKFVVTAAQIEQIYSILIGRSWTHSKEFEAYQNSWNVVSDILGVTSPHNGTTRIKVERKTPATYCFVCEGHNPNCEQCGGKGYFYEQPTA